MTVASVIVPSFRGACRLPALFDSLAAQQAGTPSFEVIVVIDGVDDGSVGLVESEDRFDVRSIVFPENRGRVAALNAGFRAARGDVLIRCDDDLVLGSDHVHTHVAAHAGGECGVIGLYRNVFTPTRYAEVYGAHTQERFRSVAMQSTPDRAWRYWAGYCSISRSTWQKVGEYDPEYRLYGWEDIDYGYRVFKAGIPVRIVPELDVEHRAAAVTAASRAHRAAYAGAARRIFERKHGSLVLPPAVPALSPWNAAVRVMAPVTSRWPRGIGFGVDTAITILPQGVARRLVGLLVESSAVGGYRRDAVRGEQF